MTRERTYQIPARSVMEAESRAILRVVKDLHGLELDGQPILSMTTDKVEKGLYAVRFVFGAPQKTELVRAVPEEVSDGSR